VTAAAELEPTYVRALEHRAIGNGGKR
jgi:hypothetical protein